MAKAKQIWRSALALTLIGLSGCQLFQFHPKATDLSLAVNDHDHVVALVREQMDLYLSEEGRAYFLNQILVALESGTRDRFKGKDPETYTWWKVRVNPYEWHQAEVVLPMEEGVETYRQLEFVDVPYLSKATMNLRSKPSTEGEALSQISKGEVFNVLAITSDLPWFVVEQQGIVKGYMHKDYARSHVEDWTILSTPPNPLLSKQLASKRSAATSSTFNNNDQPHYGVVGNYTCRMFSYELSNDGDFTTGSLRACRKQRKIWYIDSSLQFQPLQS